MESKSNISVKTKKILLGTGIAFGTLLVFVVSFFLAFTLIVNPISFNTFGSDDVAAENEELKEQIEELEGEVETLNSEVQTYENKAPEVTEPEPENQHETTPQRETAAATTNTEAQTEQSEAVETEPVEQEQEEEEEFSPDTVTTPEGGFEEEIEPDITIIDVSE